MKKPTPATRIGITLLGFILLFLSVYAYACALPMMGTSSHTHATACCLIDCRTSCSEETVQKYCESLKRMEAQNSLLLQVAPPGLNLAQGQPLSEFADPNPWPQTQLTLHALREAKLYPSRDLYTLQHTLLL